MPIDIHRESPLKINEALDLVPGRPHLSTLWRWCHRGVRGIKLETVLIGGTRFTSREALQRFFDRTTAAADGVQPVARTSAERRRSIEAAERELDDAGI